MSMVKETQRHPNMMTIAYYLLLRPLGPFFSFIFLLLFFSSSRQLLFNRIHRCSGLGSSVVFFFNFYFLRYSHACIHGNIIHDRSAKTGRACKRLMIDLDSHAWEFAFFRVWSWIFLIQGVIESVSE